MALDTASAIAKLRSLTVKFDEGLAMAAPMYPEIATIVQSTGADEEYGMLGAMPGMREWIGDRLFNRLRGQKFTIGNREWESSLAIEKSDIEDDRLGLYGPVLQNLGMEAEHHPDELMLELLVNGESQACLDGNYFFDTDHAFGDSGTQSNDLTYAAATGTTPTEAEFRAAYHQARAALIGFKRDNGKLWHRPTVKPISDLLLLVPTALEEVARQALFKEYVSGGETNIVLDRPRIVPVTYLTNAAKFYLLRTGQPLKPFVFQKRRPIQRQMKGLDDREFKDVKLMTDARYNAGYLAWWNAVLTTFT